jgi:hypothetical protein
MGFYIYLKSNEFLFAGKIPKQTSKTCPSPLEVRGELKVGSIQIHPNTIIPNDSTT